jgi:hypothetical protein
LDKIDEFLVEPECCLAIEMPVFFSKSSAAFLTENKTQTLVV